MRKFLITLIVAAIITLSIFWLRWGRQMSLLVDRSRTIQTASVPITSLRYEGSGKGGILVVNDLRLALAPGNQEIAPDIGTTKGDQLALSFGGNVFPFGLLESAPEGVDEILATKPTSGDEASLATLHSALAWVELFKLNSMIGQSLKWRRYAYYQLIWKKTSGATLEMLWRYKQQYGPEEGWSNSSMSQQGSNGLIRVEISNSTK